MATEEELKKIAETKFRTITESGIDLTAKIYLNTDTNSLKWEDYYKHQTWNLFIKYLDNRRRENPSEFDPSLNTSAKTGKTQEFLDDFNNNYVYKSKIAITEHTKETIPAPPKEIVSKGIHLRWDPQTQPGPLTQTKRSPVIEEFIWSKKYGELTVNDVIAAQKFQSITNPEGSLSKDGKSNGVQVDGVIGTQTIQMVYPTRLLMYEAKVDTNLIDSIKNAIKNNSTYDGTRYNAKSYGNNQVPLFSPLISGQTYETAIPNVSDPNFYYKLVWGNRRYVIASDYLSNQMTKFEANDPTSLNLFENFPMFPLIEKNKLIPYNNDYLKKTITGFPAWGTPVGPNWDITKPTEVYKSPQSVNGIISKAQIEAQKLKAETLIKSKITK